MSEEKLTKIEYEVIIEEIASKEQMQPLIVLEALVNFTINIINSLEKLGLVKNREALIDEICSDIKKNTKHTRKENISHEDVLTH